MPYHPDPHIIICTTFISSIDYNIFIVLQCHLNTICAEKWRKAMIYYYYWSWDAALVAVVQLDTKCNQLGSRLPGTKLIVGLLASRLPATLAQNEIYIGSLSLVFWSQTDPRNYWIYTKDKVIVWLVKASTISVSHLWPLSIIHKISNGDERSGVLVRGWKVRGRCCHHYFFTADVFFSLDVSYLCELYM